MKPTIRLVLLALLVFLAAAPAAARCLRHAPAVVTLEGTLASKRLPGPPGYENIARGDYPVTVYFLTPDAPICVTGDPTSTYNAKSHANVAEVQVEVAPERARLYVGKRIRATGTLVGAHSGAHRTPVVLEVKSLRAVEGTEGGENSSKTGS